MCIQEIYQELIENGTFSYPDYYNDNYIIIEDKIILKSCKLLILKLFKIINFYLKYYNLSKYLR